MYMQTDAETHKTIIVKFKKKKRKVSCNIPSSLDNWYKNLPHIQWNPGSLVLRAHGTPGLPSSPFLFPFPFLPLLSLSSTSLPFPSLLAESESYCVTQQLTLHPNRTLGLVSTFLSVPSAGVANHWAYQPCYLITFPIRSHLHRESLLTVHSQTLPDFFPGWHSIGSLKMEMILMVIKQTSCYSHCVCSLALCVNEQGWQNLDWDLADKLEDIVEKVQSNYIFALGVVKEKSIVL